MEYFRLNDVFFLLRLYHLPLSQNCYQYEENFKHILFECTGLKWLGGNLTILKHYSLAKSSFRDEVCLNLVYRVRFDGHVQGQIAF